MLEESAGILAAGKWTRPEGDNLNLAHFVVAVGERRRDLEWWLMNFSELNNKSRVCFALLAAAAGHQEGRRASGAGQVRDLSDCNGMTLEELIQLDGVVAAWRWRRNGGKTEVLLRTGSVDKGAADLGAVYSEMMLRVADCECMLLDGRDAPGGSLPLSSIVVGGQHLFIVGTGNGVAVSFDSERAFDLWRLEELMLQVK